MPASKSAATAELLIELFSEEIPARMQARATEDLQRLIVDGLGAQGLVVGAAHAYATPRRLALHVAGVPRQSPALSEERKGPRVGAPEQALAGFIKSAGIGSIAEAEIATDPKKGDYYVVKIDKPGRAATEIIAEVVSDVLRRFPWPKSQRWGAGDFQWVRPLQSIICLFGGKVVPFEIAGIHSGNVTRGHRFHGNAPFEVSSFEDYGVKLRDHKVLLPASERASWIAEQARAQAKSHKLELVDDDALTAENAGLTEWPTVLMGTFDKAFLDVPGECLTTSMKAHQKCFSLRDPKSKKLTNRFLLVSNLIAPDNGDQIIAGNEKVIRARLSDAKFFWDQDLKRPLDEMASQLAGITFHEQLGSQRDRVERIAEIAYEIAGSVDADKDDARRAAQICKADLVSGMVGEFPELQGLMGRYYAEKAGTKPEIARAIELHYKPKGAGDSVPRADAGDAVAIAVALADKLDTLVGFWTIGEKPTGSGDPYQLRRAALGVIRILLENDVRLPLARIIDHVYAAYFSTVADQSDHQSTNGVVQALAGYQIKEGVPGQHKTFGEAALFASVIRENAGGGQPGGDQEAEFFDGQRMLEFEGFFGPVRRDLLAFFADRLKVYLRDKGARHDLIDAVFALAGQDDFALVVKRVDALGGFLKTDDGANLLAGVKRAANILAIEEKKDKKRYNAPRNLHLPTEPAETALTDAMARVRLDVFAAINVENFTGAMNALAELRAPVDAFFEHVTVNAEDAALRENRLRLLSEIRATTMGVADFSKIGG